MLTSKQIVVVDCQTSGVAGDMFLGGLIDLGADLDEVKKALKSLQHHIDGSPTIDVTISDVRRKELHGKRADITADPPTTLTSISLISIVQKCVRDLELSEKAKKFASDVVSTLINAEARAHGNKIEEIHLHETGEIDTPAEVVGVTVALENLGFFNSDTKICSTPVAVGGGAFSFSHGIVPSPAPSTLEILRSRNFDFKGGPIDAELSTPTGAALLVNLVDEITPFYPHMKPLKVGYGAGMKDFKDMPNILRIIIGEPVEPCMLKDEVVVLETNLDDTSGEVVGYTLEKLLAEGAKDVTVTPILMKKNRPGYIISLLTDRENAERMSYLLLKETGALGVRIYPCERRILSRKSAPLNIVLDGVSMIIRLKVSRDNRGRIVQIKPEYEDLKKLAVATGRPLREIIDHVKEKASRAVE